MVTARVLSIRDYLLPEEFKMSDTSLAYRLGIIDLQQVRRLNALRAMDRLRYALEMRRLGAGKAQLIARFGKKAVEEAQRVQKVTVQRSKA